MLIAFLAICVVTNGQDGGVDKTGAAIYVRQGDDIYNFGDKRGAQGVYELALMSDPGNVRANFMMGITYLETIHKPRGLKYFLKAYEFCLLYTSPSPRDS